MPMSTLPLCRRRSKTFKRHLAKSLSGPTRLHLFNSVVDGPCDCPFRCISEVHATLFDDDNKNPSARKDAALLMLRFADLGISDVKIVDEDGRRQVQLVHRASAEEIPFEMREESLGTQVWFRLIGPALSALTNGRVLLFDELDSSLHPSLTAHLVELFQNPDTNPNGAQLIFTSHDTSLLNHLNRDEIWLTEKGADGATKLIALAEFGLDKVRRSLNIERSYLQGRFGAVPTLDRWLVQEAIGLGAN